MRDLFDDESPDQKTAINTRPIFQLRDIWPEVLERLQKLLIQEGEGDLAATVPESGARRTRFRDDAEQHFGGFRTRFRGEGEQDSGAKPNSFSADPGTVFGFPGIISTG